MGKLVLNPEFNLYEREGEPLCSSRQVAETFGKRHDHVMQTIREAIETTSSFAPEFSGANFFESRYKDRGKFYPEYLLTKDAFSYIVMGFTGKKAAAFKIAFIDRFNQMERFIKSLYAAKLEHPAFTEAVMLAHEEPKHYHFSNEADMINRLVLGVPAKKYREQNNIPQGQSIRPFLSEEDIRMVEVLQRIDIGLLTAGLDFEQRKVVLLAALARRRERLAG